MLEGRILIFTLYCILQSSLLGAHLLFPRDQEILWVSGSELPVSRGVLRQNISGCVDSNIRNMEFICPLIDNFNQEPKVDISSVDIFSGNDLVIVGESHIREEIQLQFADMISNIKDDSYKALGMEMFNVRSQPIIDQYNAGEIGIEALIVALGRDWNYRLNGYKEIIEQAHRRGLSIIALDDRIRFNELGFSDELVARDKVMADNLIRYKKLNPSHKMIAYCGRLHAFKSVDLTDQIKTISELYKEEFSTSKVKNYFFFGQRGGSTLQYLRKYSDSSENHQFFMELPNLYNYIDGAFLL